MTDSHILFSCIRFGSSPNFQPYPPSGFSRSDDPRAGASRAGTERCSHCPADTGRAGATFCDGMDTSRGGGRGEKPSGETGPRTRKPRIPIGIYTGVAQEYSDAHAAEESGSNSEWLRLRVALTPSRTVAETAMECYLATPGLSIGRAHLARPPPTSHRYKRYAPVIAWKRSRMRTGLAKPVLFEAQKKNRKGLQSPSGQLFA